MPKPISRRSFGPGGVGCLLVFFLVFALAGGGVGAILFGVPYFQGRAAQSWVERSCEILRSGLATSHDGEGTSYSIELEYEYTYDGTTYQSTRYSFEQGSSSLRDWREEVVRSLPVGSKTVCYVNPASPAEAVIRRELSPDAWFALIPLVFVVIGIGGMVFAVRAHRRRTHRLERVAELEGEGRRDLASLGLPAYSKPGESITLTPTSRPLQRLFVLFLVAGGLNTFVAFVVISEGGWFVRLFMVPFGLVGLVLIVFFLHELLGFFNPRVTIMVNSGAVEPGDRLDVGWEFRGRTERIARLWIRIEGEEEATYRQGTNTARDRDLFSVIDIVDSTDPNVIPIGADSIEIPADAMHSFSARSNKIRWRLHLTAEIRRWPDIDEKFEFVVLPPGLPASKAAPGAVTDGLSSEEML